MMTDLPASLSDHAVIAQDRELYLELGLANEKNSEALLAGNLDTGAPLQLIAGYREKHRILSTIAALSNAMAANPSPPTPEMQILVADALAELQRFMEGATGAESPTAEDPEIASGSRLETAGK